MSAGGSNWENISDKGITKSSSLPLISGLELLGLSTDDTTRLRLRIGL